MAPAHLHLPAARCTLGTFCCAAPASTSILGDPSLVRVLFHS